MFSEEIVDFIRVTGLYSSHCSAIAGYNAIYFAPKNNVVGASYGQETKKAAISKAPKQCKSRWGRGCKKVMWSNRCSSLYVSPGSGKYGYGAASGESRADANKKLINNAEKVISIASEE